MVKTSVVRLMVATVVRLVVTASWKSDGRKPRGCRRNQRAPRPQQPPDCRGAAVGGWEGEAASRHHRRGVAGPCLPPPVPAPKAAGPSGIIQDSYFKLRYFCVNLGSRVIKKKNKILVHQEVISNSHIIGPNSETVQDASLKSETAGQHRSKMRGKLSHPLGKPPSTCTRSTWVARKPSRMQGSDPAIKTFGPLQL